MSKKIIETVKEEIAAFIKAKKSRRYLEIGVKEGSHISRLNIPEKVGIEIEPTLVLEKNFKLYLGASDEVFASAEFQKEKLFDLIFVDGGHEYTQVSRDIKNSLKFLTPDGLILVHDVNPLDQKDFVSEKIMRHPKGRWTGDGWKTVLEVRYTRPEVDFAVIEKFPGWLVLWRVKTPRILENLPEFLAGVNTREPYPFDHVPIQTARQNRWVMNFGTLEDALKKSGTDTNF